MRFVWLLVAASLASGEVGSDTRLIEAMKRRDAKAAAQLVRDGVDVNAAAPDGATALAWAVFVGLDDIADKLLAAGANVNGAGEYGETPLTLALSNGNAPLVAKLLQAGANPNAARWNGETALMIAAGAGNLESVRLLLDKGVDVNGSEPKKGQTPLMWAASEGHADVVGLLLDRGATVDARTKAGYTAAAFAALNNHANALQTLLKAGANANYALPDQTSLLALATSNGSTEAALALLEGGANPNVVDKAGNTPLHLASQAGDLPLVQKLLSKGAAVDARNLPTKMQGFRPIPGELTPLLMAARANRVEVMRALIEAKADPAAKGQDGSGLLLAAAGSGRVEAAKYAYEFDKDVKAVDSLGRTAMHYTVSGSRAATQDNMVELVQYLADIGVPLDEKDARGRTPIQTGDVIPLDKPIQRMADIIVSRGGTPVMFPKEYVKPGSAK